MTRDELIALAEQHGAEVGRYEGQVVWVKLHQPSIDPFAAALSSATPAGEGLTAEALARKFHATYERLATSFGYMTREETRTFESGSANGKLMIAVCTELLHTLAASPEPAVGGLLDAFATLTAQRGGWNMFSADNAAWHGFKCGVTYANSRPLAASPVPMSDTGAQEVPSAFKTVPTEPTQRMGKAGVMVGANSTFAADMIYRAMVAEAPLLASPPPQSAHQADEIGSLEPFVVKHYSGSARPTIKGNGFDGLEVGEDREEAEVFVNWVNARITAPQDAQPGWSAEQLDKMLTETIAERDRYHEAADDLAAQIAAITNQEIGEHSSGNEPWRNAMLAADEFIAEQLRSLCRGPSPQASQSAPGEVVARVGFDSTKVLMLREDLPPGAPLYLHPATTHSAPVAGMTDEEIEAIGHRKAWRYKFSSDPHHSSTYTFNKMCLIDFARAIEAALREKDGGKA